MYDEKLLWSVNKGMNLSTILMKNSTFYLNQKNKASPFHIFSNPVTVPALVTAIPVVLLIDSDPVNRQLQNVSNQSRNYVCHKLAKHKWFQRNIGFPYEFKCGLFKHIQAASF